MAQVDTGCMKRAFHWLDAARRDARFAVRMMARQPLLTATAVLTIGLGVGANTAVVSVLETVLLNPLGLRDTAPVMVATDRVEKLQLVGVPCSGVEYRELSGMTDTFSAVAAVEQRAWTAGVNGAPSRLLGRAVTPEFFRVFGVRPFAGRFFTSDDRESVVLSYRLWKRQFGGDLAALGRVIVLDGKPHHIIGIAPAAFRFPVDAEAWAPLVLDQNRLTKRGMNMNLLVLARLKDGVTPAQARDRVNRYVQAVKDPHTGDAQLMAKLGYFVDLESFANHVAGDLRKPLWLLWAAALVVLLTACANVAALLLSRTAGRRREMAVRVSLGATRWHILRQLLTESLLLGAFGGLCGILLARAGVALLTLLTIPDGELLELVRLDPRLTVYGFALALACSLIFGLAPAVQLLRESQSAALARGGRRRFQDVFVVAEVAATLVLLIGAGLLLRSLRAIGQVKPGFDPNYLTTAMFMKPGNDPGFSARVEERLRSMPGVQSAALAYPLPFTTGGLTSIFDIRGRQRAAIEPEWHAEAYMVSPPFFATLRIPLLHGRTLTPSDSADAPLVCVIDAHLAHRFFADQDPIGQEIGMYKGFARIVGVVGAIRDTTLAEESRPVVYYSLAQVPFFPQRGIIVRSAVVTPAAMIRDAARQANAGVPVYDVRTMDDRIAESLGIRRAVSALVTIFAVVCLLLATVGIHGVIAQLVGERTQEIGIRMALGAQPGQILRHFLSRGLISTSLGIAAGLVASAYAQTWLTGMLYEVQPFDAATFAMASIGIVAVVTLAVLWPARRASKTDPQTVLRYQ